MQPIKILELQMSFCRFLAILVSYFAFKYVSYPLALIYLGILICFYVHLEDQYIFLQSVESDDDFWREEQERLSLAIEAWFGKQLPAFNLNQDDEDLALRKCHWINELIHVIWLNFQENAQNLAIKMVKDFNEHLKRKFLKVKTPAAHLVCALFSMKDNSQR